MEKISDESEFSYRMAEVRELSGTLPHAQDELTRELGKLIDDALAELTGEKFDLPRRSGDLDDADGINHLLNDYPAEVPPGKFFREAFLTTNEEAAAHYLLKLYRARDFLRMGFGLPEESIREIEAAGVKLLYWRQYGPAFQHEKRTRAERVGQEKGGRAKAENQKAEKEDRNKIIIRRAKQMVGLYSLTEALDILVREFSKRYKIGRKRIRQIVSSVFPEEQTRAKSSE